MQFQTVFLVGSSRSGTTWLQHMLGAHPNIATGQETDLFSAYVDRLRRTWTFHTRDTEEEWRQIRFKGLPAILTEAEFDEFVAGFIERVYTKVMSLKPSATILLDKDPPYSLHIDLICKYVPGARFIHMIRDGRDVAASVNAASRGWGQIWAPPKIEQAATMWRDHVLGARKAAQLGHPYVEVRYEDLLTPRGPAVLQGLFDFCGVKANAEECAAIYERFTFDRMKGHQAPAGSILWSGEVQRRFGAQLPEPDGFFREGRQGTWERTWSKYERWSFDRIAGELLRELGYVEDGWPGATPLSSLMFSLQTALRVWPKQLIRNARDRLFA